MVGAMHQTDAQIGLHVDGERWGLSESESAVRRQAFWEVSLLFVHAVRSLR
jgi:hypothetical protein